MFLLYKYVITGQKSTSVNNNSSALENTDYAV